MDIFTLFGLSVLAVTVCIFALIGISIHTVGVVIRHCLKV